MRFFKKIKSKLKQVYRQIKVKVRPKLNYLKYRIRSRSHTFAYYTGLKGLYLKHETQVNLVTSALKLKTRAGKIIAIVSASSVGMVGFQNCAKTNFKAVPKEIISTSLAEPVDYSCTFVGSDGYQKTITHMADGDSIRVWNYFSLSYTSPAQCLSQLRYCKKGVVDGDPSFIYSSCTKEVAKDCNNIAIYDVNGALKYINIKHGEQSGILYQDALVASNSSCVSGRLSCTNGVVSGNTFNEACNKKCLTDYLDAANGDINHKSSVFPFTAATVPYGSKCSDIQQTRLCTNGNLPGTARYKNCTVLGRIPDDCTLNYADAASEPLLHTKSKLVFSTSSVPFGQQCQQISASCNDGTVSPQNTTFYKNCKANDPLKCTFKNHKGETITLDHNQTYNVFPALNPPFGQQCSAQQIKCTNGTITNLTTGAVSPASPIPVFITECFNNCNFKSGYIKHGEYTPTVYPLANVLTPETCDGAPRLCTNGSLGGINSTITECHVDCNFSGFDVNGAAINQRVVHGNTLNNIFRAPTLPFNESCQTTPTNKQDRTCNEGTLSGSFQYKACGNSAATFTDIPVTGVSGSQVGDPVKLFMIVDFSPSMAEEIARVKTALRSFMDSNQSAQAFNIYLFSITHNVTDTPDANDPNLHRFLLNAPIAQLNLRTNSTTADKDAFFTLFENERAAHANDGNTTEVGLCQVLRLVKDSRYINPSDKVSFLLVSDEDDGGSCLEGYTQSPTTESRYMPVNFDFKYLTINLDVHATYQSCTYPDGPGTPVCTTTTYDGPINTGAPCPANNSGAYAVGCTNPINQTVACDAGINNLYQTNPGSLGYVTIQVNSCNYKVQNFSTSDTVYEDNSLPTTLESIKAGNSFHYLGMYSFYGNLTDWVQARQGNIIIVPGSVTSGLIQGGGPTTTATYRYHDEMYNLPVLSSLLNQKINPAMGGKLAMDFVIYNTDSTCGDGVLGYSYINFINYLAQGANAPFFKRESICQTSYQNALLLTTTLATWVPDRDYTLTGQNATNIAGIHGVKIRTLAGAETTLTSGQWSKNDTTKVLSIPTADLPKDSKIILIP